PEDRAHADLHEIFCHVTDCPYHNQKPTIDYRTPPERYHTPIEEAGPSGPTRRVDPTLLHDHLMDSLECTSPHWGHCCEPYCPKHDHHAEGNETIVSVIPPTMDEHGRRLYENHDTDDDEGGVPIRLEQVEDDRHVADATALIRTTFPAQLIAAYRQDH